MSIEDLLRRHFDEVDGLKNARDELQSQATLCRNLAEGCTDVYRILCKQMDLQPELADAILLDTSTINFALSLAKIAKSNRSFTNEIITEAFRTAIKRVEGNGLLEIHKAMNKRG